MARKGQPRSKAEIKADMNRTGRPQLKEYERRSKQLNINVTPQEYTMLKRSADLMGISIANLLMKPWRETEEVEE